MGVLHFTGRKVSSASIKTKTKTKNPLQLQGPRGKTEVTPDSVPVTSVCPHPLRTKLSSEKVYPVSHTVPLPPSLTKLRGCERRQSLCPVLPGSPLGSVPIWATGQILPVRGQVNQTRDREPCPGQPRGSMVGAGGHGEP